jgi:hypothetical protein
MPRPRKPASESPEVIDLQDARPIEGDDSPTPERRLESVMTRAVALSLGYTYITLGICGSAHKPGCRQPIEFWRDTKGHEIKVSPMLEVDSQWAIHSCPATLPVRKPC